MTNVISDNRFIALHAIALCFAGGLTVWSAAKRDGPVFGRSAVALALFLIALVFVVPVQDGSIPTDSEEGFVSVGLAFETAAIIEFASVIALLLPRLSRFRET